jgi:signal transduction histidine kinase
MQAVSTANLVEESVVRFRSAHPERKLLTNVSDQLPEIDADPVLLRRVVDNLLDNARKYSEPNEPVTLSSHVENNSILIEVRDRGIGMGPEDLRNVFTPFFRSDRSRARGTGGVGLGLALAKRVAEAHGGKLNLESMAGLGTVARLSVPIRGSAGAKSLA